MDAGALKTELDGDPLGRGYSGMSDAEAAADLNTAYRTATRDSVGGCEIFNATDDTEYAALTDAQKSSWDALCGIEQIDTTNGVAKAREAELFGPGTTTRSNLAGLRSSAISRATELGLGVLKVGHVAEVRRM